MKIPNGHQAVMPYLMLRSATAFTGFVKTVFNATQSFSRMREDGTTLMHGEVQVNGSTIMFCDVTSDWEEANANLFVYVDNADEVFAKAIEAGASVVMELRDESYGRTCGVKDPVGNTWWITSVA
ncbi:MAG: VOC family protein [Sphingobacteriales bacterium]|nr:VOC family protein [Sphingobacteriales bacterium]